MNPLTVSISRGYCRPAVSLRLSLWFIAGLAATGGGCVFGQGSAPDVKVAAGSVVITAVPGEKKIEASFRLVDDPSVTVVQSATANAADPLAIPTTWRSFAGMPGAACAWLVVIDNSNPRRAQTVGACVEQVRRFLTLIPEGDAVMVATLARDLVVISPFGTKSPERELALTAVKASGEASLATLIYQNLRMGIDEHLKDRPEVRKAVVILTDGKDETPGGADAVRLQMDQLIERARGAKVAIHTLGFAEIASEAAFFGNFKELSNETDGLHAVAAVASRELPANTWETLAGVMHGGGVATLDLAALTGPTPILLQVRTAAGGRASLSIDLETVKAALAPVPEPTPDPAADGDEPAPADPPVSGPADPTNAGDAPAVADPGRSVGFLWWSLAGGVALILLVALVVASQRKAKRERLRLADLRAAEQARILNEQLSEETRPEATRIGGSSASTPLAYLEMCDTEQTRYPVTVPSLRIGRGQHNDLVLRNDSVSGNHSVLQRDRRGEWTITDLDSGNGVLVNGARVQKAILRHGDAVEFGDLKMRFLLNL